MELSSTATAEKKGHGYCDMEFASAARAELENSIMDSMSTLVYERAATAENRVTDMASKVHYRTRRKGGSPQ